MRSKIPEFTNDDDVEQFVDTADLAQYDLTGFKRVQLEFQAKTAQLNMRLPRPLLDAVKESAEDHGITYTRFVQEALEAAVISQARSESSASGARSNGNLQLIMESRSVLIDGRLISLTVKEYDLFEFLVMRRNMVITAEFINYHLYRDVNNPETKMVHVLVAKLRKKLSDAGAINVIITVWGRGYLIRNTVSEQSRKRYSLCVAS